MKKIKLFSKKYGVLFFLVFAAFFLGLNISDNKTSADCDNSYKFINQNLGCNNSYLINKGSYMIFQEHLRDYLLDEQESGRIIDAGVYFRDLNDGAIFGVNEIADFAPASLLKVPIALIFLSFAEKDPSILSHELPYVKNANTVNWQRVKPDESLTPEKTYPIGDLIRRMIVYSDNAAYETLELFLQRTPELMQMKQIIFQELGFIDPKTRIEETLNLRSYSGIFRQLYNVSYLDRNGSERVLEWLTLSNFDQGLVAGVPKDIIVAHKFGERFDKSGTKQLHDCGIVYYPDNPYLLCVMTKGTDFDVLTNIIQTVSRKVYEEVDSRRL